MPDACSTFSVTSRALKASAILLSVTFIVQCVGISTNYWMHVEAGGFEIYSGLWKHCSCFNNLFGFSTDKACYCLSWSGYEPAWLKAVQAMEVIGIVAVGIVGVMTFMQLFRIQGTGIKIWGIIFTMLAGVCILVGVTVYAANVINNLNFSFGMCTVAGILCLLCTILLLSDRQTALRSPPPTVAGRQYPVHYTNQGHVILPPQGQVVIAYTGQPQHPGNPPPYAHVQYGAPPSYPAVQQQSQFTHQHGLQTSYPPEMHNKM